MSVIGKLIGNRRMKLVCNRECLSRLEVRAQQAAAYFTQYYFCNFPGVEFCLATGAEQPRDPGMAAREHPPFG